MEKTEYDEVLKYIKKKKYPADRITKDQKKTFRKKCKKFIITKGKMHRWEDGVVKAIVEKDQVAGILYQNHDIVTGGHMGINNTYINISKRYYWPGMYNDVQTYVKNCKICAASSELKKDVLPLIPIKVNYRFERIGIDLIGPFAETRSKNKYILVVTEYFTKYADAFPIPNKKAFTVANILFHKIFMKWGCVECISSDQGKEFNNNLLDEILKLLGIDKRLSQPYHPQTNGLTERFNKTLIKMLSKFVNDKQDDWDNFIDTQLFVYNTSDQASTKYTPFYLVNLREPVKPTDFVLNSIYYLLREKMAVYLTTKEREDAMKKAESVAKVNIINAQAKQKKDYNKRLGNYNFEIGDIVLLAHNKKGKVSLNKLDLTYSKIEYMIVEIKNDRSYRIQNLKTNKNLGTWHQGNKLKKLSSKKLKEDLVELLKEPKEVIDLTCIDSLEDGESNIEDELFCLNGENWLTNYVIDSFCERILEESDYTYLNSGIAYSIYKEYSINSEWLQKFKNGDSEWFTVLLVDGNHWICLYFMSKNSVRYYDPYQRDRSKNVITFLKGYDELNRENYSINAIEFILQTDSYNCGVYCCFFIDYWVNNALTRDFCPSEYRELMRKIIKK